MFSFLVVVPAAYLTVYIGLQTPARIWIINKGDFSYGLYLFAYPIQQLVVLLTHNQISTIVHFLVSSALSLCYAIVSWNLVEKRVLAQKSVAVRLVQRMFGRAEALSLEKIKQAR